MNIRVSLAAAFLATGLGLAATSAEAFPVMSGTGGFDNGMVQNAAYMCGPGMTRGPYGHCRPRFSCPRGFHPGPQGFHCFPNRRWR